MFWDDEPTPSVNVPLVDFFCDPAGLREEVNTALVNKRRGFNCYFPMPFRRSARVELVYDGPLSPGEPLWRIMPCYSYVMYRTLEKVDDDRGYFHAAWRQEALLLGQRDYLALEAKGRGKFIGWNATVRLPGRAEYPVDQNEKFSIDGEDKPSIEFQGMEDSFGFSWGFPPTESQFPADRLLLVSEGGGRVPVLPARRHQLREIVAGDRSASASTKTRCSAASSPGGATRFSSPARSTGIKQSRTPPCPLFHPSPTEPLHPSSHSGPTRRLGPVSSR